MNKLLVVCGTTATGKTKLGLNLAKRFKGEIISADSRQVYEFMDIGTGKDLPRGAKLINSGIKVGRKEIGYYLVNKIKVWGYDLVSPKKKFSVYYYRRFVLKIISDINKRGKLPILVGGTGLYLKSIIDPISTVEIPVNKILRKSLSSKSAVELFEILARVDAVKAGSLNISDKKNPRRLVRAIEVGLWRQEKKKSVKLKTNENLDYDLLIIGLKLKKKLLEERIEKRVRSRIEKGFDKEVNDLIRKKVSWESQAMNALGYQQWKNYLQGDWDLEKTINQWALAESKYAKRQITWFKKDKRIIWFDAEDGRYQKSIEKLVNKWYNK